MMGFEMWTSGIGSDRSTNWATITVPIKIIIYHSSFFFKSYLNTYLEGLWG